MKTKKADLVYKIFFIVVGVILSGLMIAWLVSTYNDKKNEADAGTKKINRVTSQMADFDLTIYDGASIKGEALTDLITALKEKGAQVSVTVKTLDNTLTSYIYGTTSTTPINLDSAVTVTPPLSKSATGYITPTGNFKGEVIRNANDVIVCLYFTQHK